MDKAEEMDAVADKARASSELMAAAFERAGARIEAALIGAARTGEVSFARMAEAILRDLARLAAPEIGTRLGLALARGLGGGAAPAGEGAKAAGPVVASNMAPVIVNVTLGAGADASAVRRSEGQIAAALARAVRKGAARL